MRSEEEIRLAISILDRMTTEYMIDDKANAKNILKWVLDEKEKT